MTRVAALHVSCCGSCLSKMHLDYHPPVIAIHRIDISQRDIEKEADLSLLLFRLPHPRLQLMIPISYSAYRHVA